MNWNITALVGVPGVGKTSLCKTATGQVGIKYVNYGELMLEVATSNDLASSQDEMFCLELEVQEFIWKQAANQVRNMAKNQNVLVDLHGLDISNQGYIQSLPIETFCPDLIVIVEASYEDIMLRRMGDETRNRSLVDLKSLEDQFQLLRMSMMSAAVLCGAFVKILYNDDFDGCVTELVKLLSTGS
jgi:adenylate kinase